MDMLNALLEVNKLAGSVIDEKGSKPTENLHVIRSNLGTINDCESFVKKFGEITETRWIVHRTIRQDPAR